MNKQTQFTIADFEDTAKQLLTIAYALTDQRYQDAVRRKTFVGRVMQEAVICLQAAVNTFLFIARLPKHKR